MDARRPEDYRPAWLPFDFLRPEQDEAAATAGRAQAESKRASPGASANADAWTDAPGPRQAALPGLALGVARIPPLERLGQPEDIAGVVSFLAGPDGGWVNSQVVRANGGFA